MHAAIHQLCCLLRELEVSNYLCGWLRHHLCRHGHSARVQVCCGHGCAISRGCKASEGAESLSKQDLYPVTQPTADGPSGRTLANLQHAASGPRFMQTPALQHQQLTGYMAEVQAHDGGGCLACELLTCALAPHAPGLYPGNDICTPASVSSQAASAAACLHSRADAKQ